MRFLSGEQEVRPVSQPRNDTVFLEAMDLLVFLDLPMGIVC